MILTNQQQAYVREGLRRLPRENLVLGMRAFNYLPCLDASTCFCGLLSERPDFLGNCQLFFEEGTFNGKCFTNLSYAYEHETAWLWAECVRELAERGAQQVHMPDTAELEEVAP